MAEGPSYLEQSVEQWPIDRNFALRKEMCIPDEEILKRYRGQVHEIQINIDPDHSIHKLINVTSTNNRDRLIQRTQILLIPFLNNR